MLETSVSPGALTFAGGRDPYAEWRGQGCIAQTCHHRALIPEFHVGKNRVGHPEPKAIGAQSELLRRAHGWTPLAAPCGWASYTFAG